MSKYDIAATQHFPPPRCLAQLFATLSDFVANWIGSALAGESRRVLSAFQTKR